MGSEKKNNTIVELLNQVRRANSDEKFLELLNLGGNACALEIAKSQNATPSILDYLLRFRPVAIRHAVAKNNNTSISTLEALTSDSEMLVRDSAKVNLLLRAS